MEEDYDTNARKRLIQAVMRRVPGPAPIEEKIYPVGPGSQKYDNSMARALAQLSLGSPDRERQVLPADLESQIKEISQLPPMTPDVAQNLSNIFSSGAIGTEAPFSDAERIIGRLIYGALHPVSTLTKTIKRMGEKDDDEN